jgi:hypothetical protein
MYGIPRSTLSYRLKESNVLSVGRPTVFTAAEEKIIANVIKVSQDRLLPMTSTNLRGHLQDVLVEEVTKGVRRIIPAGFVNYYPTKRWLEGFMKRNGISFRTPESYSKSRGNVTEGDIRQWFTDTQEYLDSQ